MSGKSNAMERVFEEAMASAVKDTGGFIPGGLVSVGLTIKGDHAGHFVFTPDPKADPTVWLSQTVQAGDVIGEWEQPAFTTGKTAEMAFGFVPPSARVTDAEVYCERTAQEVSRMREIIMERGWVQHTLFKEGRVCLLGAASVLAGDLEYDEGFRRRKAVTTALTRYLAQQGLLDPYTGSLPQWNDAKGRTVGEVLDMLEQAAIWVKEKASAW